MKKPYTLRKASGRNISVEFRHIPGKRISTGTSDMAEAILFAERYLQNDGKVISHVPTLSEFSKDFFTEKDPHGIRLRDKARNRNFSTNYYEQHQSRLDNYILPKFGNYLIDSINDVMIEDWLLSLKSFRNGTISDSTKNKILMCFRIVLKEAKRKGLVSDSAASQVALITPRHQHRKPFNQSELGVLFPRDNRQLLYIWGGAMWASYFMIMRDTGFRPGEVAGLQKKHYIQKYHGIFTEQSVDFLTGKIKSSIKTTSKGQPYKVGVLTGQTSLILESHLMLLDDDDFMFLVNKATQLITPDTGNKHLIGALNRAGIPQEGRTQYSFRHAFETDILGNVKEKDMLRLMGHTSYRKEYDHREVENMLEQLQPVRAVLEDRTNKP